MAEDHHKGLVDLCQPAVEVLLDVLEVGHRCWVLTETMSVLLEEALARLLGDCHVPQAFGVVGGYDADPPHVVELDVRHHILVLLVSALSDNPRAPAVYDASEPAVSSAFLEAMAGVAVVVVPAFLHSAVLGRLPQFPIEALVAFLFLGMDVGGYLEVLLGVEVEVVFCLSSVPDAVVSSSVHKL
jgi:hypothetical protein